MAEVKMFDNYIEIFSCYGIMKIAENGFVWNSEIEAPISGLAIIGNKIYEYDGRPEIVVKKNGMEHYLGGFTNDNEPFYVVSAGSIVYFTTDFKKYYDEYFHTRYDLEKVQQHVKQQLYKKIRVDDQVFYTAPDTTNGVITFLYPDGNKVIEIEIPFDKFKKEMSKEEVLLFSKKIVHEFTVDIQKYVKEIKPNRAMTEPCLSYIFKNGLRIDVTRDKIYADYGVVDKNKVEALIKNGVTVLLEKIVEDVHPPLPEFEGDLKSIIRDLTSKAPYFGEKYAVPTKHRIQTARGEIIVKNLQNIPEPFIRIAEWVLGMRNDLFTSNRTLRVSLNGDQSSAEIISGSGAVAIKIGEQYYWYNYRKRRYEGPNKILISTDRSGVKKYDGKVIDVGMTTPVTPLLKKKLKMGKRITINDILPGFPEDGKISNKNYRKCVCSVGNKVFELEVRPYRNGVYATIPYLDGVYTIFIPEDNTIDVWSALYASKLPEKHIIDEKVYIGFAKDLPPSTKIMFVEGKFKLEWENNYIIVFFDWKEPTRAVVHINDFTFNVGRDNFDVMCGATSLDQLFFALSL